MRIERSFATCSLERITGLVMNQMAVHNDNIIIVPVLSEITIQIPSIYFGLYSITTPEQEASYLITVHSVDVLPGESASHKIQPYYSATHSQLVLKSWPTYIAWSDQNLHLIFNISCFLTNTPTLRKFLPALYSGMYCAKSAQISKDNCYLTYFNNI